MKKYVLCLIFLLVTISLIGFTGCEEKGDTSGNKSESETRQSEKTDDYVYSPTGETTAEFLGFKKVVEGNAVIPSEIDGYVITKIGRGEDFNIFAGGGGNVTSVYIPSKAEEIGDYAFAGLKNLVSVTFGTGSLLETIGFRAFYDCQKLSGFNSDEEGTLHLPTRVKKVDDYAFYGTNFINIKIGSATENIGVAAFARIPALRDITVEQNEHYKSCNGVLYETGSFGRIMQYPIASPYMIYVLPQEYEDTIKYVNEYAFAGAKRLGKADLKNVQSIADHAFADTTRLTYVNGDKITDVSETAFVGSQLLENVTFACVGEVMLKYNGTAKWLSASDFPSSASSIAPYAFAGNETLEQIDLPDNISAIKHSAFDGCVNLGEVRILNTRLPDIDETSFSGCSDDLKFIVRKSAAEEAGDKWQKYADKFSLIHTDVYFEDLDLTVPFYYGEKNVPPECKKAGYYFLNWVRTDDGQNNYIYEQGLKWDSLESNAAYKAEFAKITVYNLIFWNGEQVLGTARISPGDVFSLSRDGITINGNKEELSAEYKMNNCAYGSYYGSSVIDGIEIATFNGWKIDGKLVENEGAWVNEYYYPILDVYADWIPMEFEATLTDPNNTTEKVKFTYFDEVILPAPSREGYEFVGWKDEKGKYYKTLKGLADNITLRAVYELKQEASA